MDKMQAIYVELYQAERVYTTDPEREIRVGLEVFYCEQILVEPLDGRRLVVTTLRGGRKNRLLYQGNFLALLSEEFPNQQ